MIQCFYLTTKQHQPAYKPKKRSKRTGCNLEINPVGHGFAHQNNGMEVDQDAEDDDQMEMDVVENWVPQHPDQP